MFSIKVIQEDGSEFVKSEVRSVAFNPPILETGKSPSLFIWYKDSPAETLTSGRIFIMNENGKTVSDYNLYGLPVQLDRNMFKENK